jgi:hypothetical protein
MNRVYECLNEPGALHAIIAKLASIPPVVMVRVSRNTTYKYKDKTSNLRDDYGDYITRAATVTQFTICVPLVEFSQRHLNRPEWNQIRILDDHNQDCHITLKELCDGFRTDAARFKRMRFKRRVKGYDTSYIISELKLLLQESGVAVKRDELSGSWNVDIFSENNDIMLHTNSNLPRWISRLLAKTYGTVKVYWLFSRDIGTGRREYAALSEKEWLDKWTIPIQRAAKAERTCTLTEEDIIRYS